MRLPSAATPRWSAARARSAAAIRARRTPVLVPEVDTALREVVRRHLDRDAVAGENADAVLLHAAGCVGDHLVPVVELHTAAGVRQNFVHHAFELEHLFFRHSISELI